MACSVIILTNRNELTYTSDFAFKGDGYYGFADGLHTISFHVVNFTGRIHLEATIVEHLKKLIGFNLSTHHRVYGNKQSNNNQRYF